ncbi:MAG: hypothetical protein ACYS8W_10740 [Planctomycetota bacterium]|jgi:hypothetical protein
MFGKKKKKKKDKKTKYARDHSIGQEIHGMIDKRAKGQTPLGIGAGPALLPSLAPAKGAGKFKMKGGKKETKVRKGDYPGMVSAMFKGLPQMKAGAKSKLMGMTARDFGQDRDAWERFYEENSHLEIADWQKSGLAQEGINIEGKEGRELILTLIQALPHAKLHVREAAYAMLKEKPGPVVPFQPNGSPEAIDKFYRKWYEWFEKSK